jgi:c-di-GMP-binding flagellar brake protein YcgR
MIYLVHSQPMDPINKQFQDIADVTEIGALLRLAHRHRWNFSYTVESERRHASHNTELVAVNSEGRTMTVGSEVKYSGLQPEMPVTFRAQSGGISLQFDSEMIGVGGNALSNRLFSECRFRFPEAVKFTQLRKAIRVDCESIDDISVTVFANGTRLQGKVADLSTTGTKIRFQGNLSYQFKNSRIVTDCRMRLPDGAVLEARVKLLGFFYDRKLDISFLRCYFLEIREDREVLLEELIQAALADSTSLAMNF